MEVSSNNFISNPNGWSDGIIAAGIIKNAMFTDFKGNLLSSLFFTPEIGAFSLKTIAQLNQEFLSEALISEKDQDNNDQNFGVNILFSFSKSEANQHLNVLLTTSLINPVFAPDNSIYHYTPPKLKNYFEKIESRTLINYKGQTKNIKDKTKVSFKPASNIPSKFVSKDQVFQLFLKLFDIKTVFSPKDSRGITSEVVNDQFIFSVLGDLNMIFDVLTGKVDSNSKGTGQDFEGILAKLFNADEIKDFLFLQDDLTPVHKDGYKQGQVSTIKQWLYILYEKIANFPDSNLGADRISTLIKEARDKLLVLRKNPDKPSDPPINPLNIDHINGKINEKHFSTDEAKAGQDIYKIISRLFGHDSLRLVFFHMVKFNKGKVDFTTRPILTEFQKFLDQFDIKAPTQDDILNPIKSLGGNSWKPHMYALVFGDSRLHLPMSTGERNDNNIVRFGYSTIQFIQDSFTSSTIDLDIQAHFWAQYKAYFRFLYDNKGFTSKLNLFVLSGKEMVKAISSKLDKYANIPTISKELIDQLKAEAEYEVFRTHNEVGYAGGRYNAIRIQIENFLNSNDYSRKITFYQVLDGSNKPVSIWFTKDDFRGYFILKFGKVKSNQFLQGDVDDLINTYNYFKFRELLRKLITEKLKFISFILVNFN